MKIKNISVGDFVQVKKRLVSNMFKAKQVCEVIRIDSEHKFRPDVLIKGEYCLEWVNHKDLKKPIKREPEPQLKQLDQSVFDGLDEKWRFAAVNAAGRLMYSKTRMVHDKKYWWASSKSSDLSSGTDGYDASNWQSSLIERDIAKELTGSELCKAMLERGDKFVVCKLADTSEADAISNSTAKLVTEYDGDGFYHELADSYWYFAVPINNQSEPLTQAEAGL